MMDKALTTFTTSVCDLGIADKACNHTVHQTEARSEVTWDESDVVQLNLSNAEWKPIQRC